MMISPVRDSEGEVSTSIMKVFNEDLVVLPSNPNAGSRLFEESWDV
jgi:hypothetical protein